MRINARRQAQTWPTRPSWTDTSAPRRAPSGCAVASTNPVPGDHRRGAVRGM